MLKDLEICWKIKINSKNLYRINYSLSHLVGELGETAFFTWIGDGEGVLANGDKGIMHTDFLRLVDGDLTEPPIECNLCFNPWSELGLWWKTGAAFRFDVGVLGTDDDGDEDWLPDEILICW